MQHLINFRMAKEVLFGRTLVCTLSSQFFEQVWHFWLDNNFLINFYL